MDNFYVYVYIDPRNHEEFYYEKGNGSRKKVQDKSDGDSEIIQIILDIKKEGLEPIIKAVAKGLAGNEALIVAEALNWKLGKSLSGNYSDNFRPHNKNHLDLAGFDFENGVFYVNVDEDYFFWDDCLQYGIFPAIQPLDGLEVDDVVVAYLKGYGYVGVGKVLNKAVPFNQFKLGARLLSEFPLKQGGVGKNKKIMNSEYLVKVEWIKAVKKKDAKGKSNSSLFTTETIIASLNDQPKTLQILEKEFEIKFADIFIHNVQNKSLLLSIDHLNLLERKRNQVLGCLLGGAIGDALGAPVEFLTTSQILRQYGAKGVEGYVEHDNEKGEFTDDTQMSLFTAEGMLRCWHLSSQKGIHKSPLRFMHTSYLRWLKTQGLQVPPQLVTPDFTESWLLNEKALHKRREPGNTCLNALSSGEKGTVERPINDSKGCGTIMKIAPVGLLYDDPRMAFDRAVEISALTHGHPSGYLSAGLLAAIIVGLKNGLDLKYSITQSLQILRSKERNEEVYRTVNAALELHRIHHYNDLVPHVIEQLGEGWVAEEALAISLLCALRYQDDFEKGVLAAVNHSGDSDSTGSITGNLIGMIVGADAIPDHWKNNLLNKEIVEQIADDLHKANNNIENKIWKRKYPLETPHSYEKENNQYRR